MVKNEKTKNKKTTKTKNDIAPAYGYCISLVLT